MSRLAPPASTTDATTASRSRRTFRTASSPRRVPGLLCLELANVPGGYGWVFPKGDHVNVGVGGWESEGPSLRAHLARFCREYGIPESSLENVRGHRLPLIHARARVAQGRVALLAATPPAWSTRSPATACTRRSSRRSSPPKRSSPATSRATTAELRRRLSSQLAAASGREGRARPLPTAHLRGRADAVPLECGRLA